MPKVHELQNEKPSTFSSRFLRGVFLLESELLPAYRAAVLTVKMSCHVSPVRPEGWEAKRSQINVTRPQWWRHYHLISFCVWLRVWVCSVISWERREERDGGLFASVFISSSACICMFVCSGDIRLLDCCGHCLFTRLSLEHVFDIWRENSFGE